VAGRELEEVVGWRAHGLGCLLVKGPFESGCREAVLGLKALLPLDGRVPSAFSSASRCRSIFELAGVTSTRKPLFVRRPAHSRSKVKARAFSRRLTERKPISPSRLWVVSPLWDQMAQTPSGRATRSSNLPPKSGKSCKRTAGSGPRRVTLTVRNSPLSQDELIATRPVRRRPPLCSAASCPRNAGGGGPRL